MTIETLKTEGEGEKSKVFLHVHVHSRLYDLLSENSKQTMNDDMVVVVEGKFYLIDLSFENSKALISPAVMKAVGKFYQPQPGHRVPENQVKYLGNVNGFDYPAREIAPEEAGRYLGLVIDISSELRHPRLREAVEKVSFLLGI